MISTDFSKVVEMRRLWSIGEPTLSIAMQLDVSYKTVERYCESVSRPITEPLNASDRQQLLQNWK